VAIAVVVQAAALVGCVQGLSLLRLVSAILLLLVVVVLPS
jgi:hypothetical protein